MAEGLGKVRIDLIANVAEFVKSIDFADKKVKTFGADAIRTLDKFGKIAKKFGTEMSLYVTAPLVGLAAAATKAADPTGKFSRQLQGLGREAQSALRPLGESLIRAFEDMRPAIEGVLDVVRDLSETFAALPRPLQTTVIGATAFVAVMGPLALGVASVTTAVKGLTTALATLNATASGGAAAKALSLFGKAGIVGAVGWGTYETARWLLDQPKSSFEADRRAGLANAAGAVIGSGVAGLGPTVDLAALKRAQEWRESVRPLEVLQARLRDLNELAAEFPLKLTPEVVSDLADKWRRELDPAVREFEQAQERIRAAIQTQTETAFPERGIERQRREIAELLTQGLPLDVATKRLAQLDKELKALQDKLDETFGAKLRDKVKGFATDASNALADFVIDGKANLEDLAKSWGRTLTAMAAQAALFQPFFDAFGKAIGSIFGAKEDPTAGGAQTQRSAHGNAYDRRGVIPFAKGGVVTRPRLFPFAKGIGLMGEAGPEAILPLKRIGGDLGVKASGGGVVVNIIDQRGQGAPVEVRESTSADGQRTIDVIVRDAVRRLAGSGQLDRLLGHTYGLRRRGK